MELRRATDVLLRSQTSPLSAALNLRTTVRWTNRAQLDISHRPNRLAQRCLSTTSRRYALRDTPTTTTTTAPRLFQNDSPSNTESSRSSTQPSPPKNSAFDLSASLGWTSGNKNRPIYPMPRASGQLEKNLNGGSSATDLLAGLRQRRDQVLRGNSSGSTIQVDKMMDPFAPVGGGVPKEMMMQTADETMVHKRQRVQLKLGPSTGRTVTVGQNVDPARAFRLLEQSCARNRVRADFKQQVYHERGGLKRKRLVRERWRKRFLEGFKATVGRVKQLKNQGW